MTAYCTYADIVNQTATTIPQATVEALIADAGRRINGKLRMRGMSYNYSSSELIAAAIALSTAKVLTRMRFMQIKPNSVTLPNGATLSDNNDLIIKQLEAEADELVESYISSAWYGGGYEVAVRVDSNILPFRLDQAGPADYTADGSSPVFIPVKGEKGDPGVSGDAAYTYTQSIAATIWTINHSLNKYPSVIIVDNTGDSIEGDVSYPSNSQVIITFSSAVAGKAYLN